jgi:hypothetical protein
MERVLALQGRNSQLVAEDLFAGVIRQLKVVDASHDGWQVEVGVDVGTVEGLLHDGQVGAESFETADGQTRASGDELQELALLFPRVARHHFVEHLDAARLRRVAVIRLAALRQALDVPRRVVGRGLGGAAEYLVELLREKHFERREGKHGLEAFTNCLHLLLT